MMPSIDEVIDKTEKLRNALWANNVQVANQRLRDLISDPSYGLGVAILVAWKHGLREEHIPLSDPDLPQVCHTEPSEACPYTFVHVPIRKIRRDVPELTKRGILQPNADPALLVYHEDGLVGTFSFQQLERLRLTKPDIAEILRSLAQQGVLAAANIDNRQIQFKDLAVKRRIEASSSTIYVRLNDKPIDRGICLPAAYDREAIWDYIKETLRYKFACNYCSVQALNTREVTLNTTRSGSSSALGTDQQEPSTVRNYQMGFTFAPVGDPRNVCHFLAWDFPHISDLVMNMEPQAYSFSDLIALVRRINKDIRKLYDTKFIQPSPQPVTGACNHFAGNSIYHQHYQFYRLPVLPLVKLLNEAEVLVRYQGVEVSKPGDAWPAPAYFIRAHLDGTDEDVMKVADKVAREWRVMTDRKDEDPEYGNKIMVGNHTQNTLVTILDDQLVAIYIPRVRSRVTTSNDQNAVQKPNAGVLEMTGYFIIDEPADFRIIDKMSDDERRLLGDSWLSELSPGRDKVAEFEDSVKICLSTDIEHYEQRIDDLSADRPGDWRTKARDLMVGVQEDQTLASEQREHVYRELIWALLESNDSELESENPE
jgi:hypothetical protein